MILLWCLGEAAGSQQHENIAVIGQYLGANLAVIGWLVKYGKQTLLWLVD